MTIGRSPQCRSRFNASNVPLAPPPMMVIRLEFSIRQRQRQKEVVDADSHNLIDSFDLFPQAPARSA
jgi:hypothetical protein